MLGRKNLTPLGQMGKEMPKMTNSKLTGAVGRVEKTQGGHCSFMNTKASSPFVLPHHKKVRTMARVKIYLLLFPLALRAVALCN